MVPIGATVALRIGERIEDGQVRADTNLDHTARSMLTELVAVAGALRSMRARPAPEHSEPAQNHTPMTAVGQDA